MAVSRPPSQNTEGAQAHTSPKGISPKVNIIAPLEFEHGYYDDAVQHINHYATENLFVNL